MIIYHFSAECYPIAKVGGLADVVGALPKYQQKEGYAAVVMPFYENKFIQTHWLDVVHQGDLLIGERYFTFEILKCTDGTAFDLYFVKIPYLLDREQVYGYHDDIERFLAFQIAGLKWILSFDVFPDVIHCHDHHTGFIPFLVQECFIFRRLRDIPTVFTIHNAEYQGYFGYDRLYYFPDYDRYQTGLLDWMNTINPMASAIKCAWKVTTVSPNYMQELMLSANNLETLISTEKQKCLGILNGIDPEVWNTESDPMLIKNYTKTTVQQGKKANKESLCTDFDLDPEKPLFIFIGRLVREKGADLFPELVHEVLGHRQLDVSLLFLGSGNSEIEQQLLALRELYAGKYNVYVGYDESLSRRMYGGGDFLLMPSRVEPCGLNQMYALRYGTIPIVRATGGLKDTVIDLNKSNGFGFVHQEASVPEIADAVERAVQLYGTPKIFQKLRKQIMQIDTTWNRSASEYIDLYKSLTITYG